jgi:hypothetical protein
MKRNFIILSALLLLAACNNSKDLNSWSCDGLSGKVKTLMSKCYEATERFGEVEKMNIIEYYDSEYEIPLHPAYLAEYNEEGNVVKFTTYDEDGERLSVVKSEYIGNNQVAKNAYDSDGEVYYSWKLEVNNDKVVDCTQFNEHEIGNKVNSDFEFDGYLLKAYNTYEDSVLISRTENKFYKNRLSESIRKDTSGNVTYQQNQEWTEAGQLIYQKCTSEGEDKLIINCEYDNEDRLVKYTRRGEWSSRDANYTFKYTSFDKHGNWLSRVIYSNDKAYIVEERTIEYYD